MRNKPSFKKTFKELFRINSGLFSIHRTGDYMGSHFFVRRCGYNRWEYILFHDLKFYSAFMFVNPKWWRIIFPQTYSDSEIKGICNYLVNMVCATIETLIKEKSKEKEKSNAGENK